LTEVIQPLAPAVPFGQSDTAERHAPSFTELVYAHFAWWRELRSDAATGKAAAAYQDVLRRFEQSRGRILHSYWCSELESAVALTEIPRAHRWQRRRLGFHRESDWATKQHPQIAAELHRCDELAVRAQEVLTGVRQRICLQLVTSSAAHLLSLVDEPAAHPTSAGKELLARERRELQKVEAYYRQAANGQAQITYFAGMATVLAVVALLTGIALAGGWKTGVASVLAGAIGAVVSVVQRINANDFELDYDVGRPYAFFLGGLRPLIGGALALAIAYTFTGGLLHLPVSSNDPSTDQRLALIVISFVAGFSERWAQDTLATAVPKVPAETKKGQEPPQDGDTTAAA